jgi:hypothetical protein
MWIFKKIEVVKRTGRFADNPRKARTDLAFGKESPRSGQCFAQQVASKLRIFINDKKITQFDKNYNNLDFSIFYK